MAGTSWPEMKKSGPRSRDPLEMRLEKTAHDAPCGSERRPARLTPNRPSCRPGKRKSRPYSRLPLFETDRLGRAYINACPAIAAGIRINGCQTVFHGDRVQRAGIHARFTSGAFFSINYRCHSYLLGQKQESNELSFFVLANRDGDHTPNCAPANAEGLGVPKIAKEPAS
jgi:hypothetical protein